MKLNRSGMEVFNKWEEVYRKELENERKLRNDPEYSDGWCIIDDSRYVKDEDDALGILIFGDDDSAICHIMNCVENGTFKSYDDEWAFGKTCREMIIALLPYFDMVEEEKNCILNELTAKYRAKIEELKDNGMSIQNILACIHDVWQNNLIDEDEENFLYNLVDPDEEYNDVFDYWYNMDFENPLLNV